MSTDWDLLARVDPLWAICSRPEARNGGWSLRDFFATGEAEVAAVLERPEAQPAQWRVAVDFGCGVGRLSRALAARFGSYVGLDASVEMIDRARRLNADVPNCSFEVGDLTRVESGSVDFVYSAFVLQHLGSEREIAGRIGDFLRVVAPGGAVVFQLPERPTARQRSSCGHFSSRSYGGYRSETRGCIAGPVSIRSGCEASTRRKSVRC